MIKRWGDEMRNRKNWMLVLLIMLALWLCGSAAYAAVNAPLDLTAVTTDTSGEGWSWDAAKKTLTLNGFVYEDKESGEAAILLPEDATIVVADGTVNTIRTQKSVGILNPGGMFTITGKGELHINMQGGTGISSDFGSVCSIDSVQLFIDGTEVGIEIGDLGLYYQKSGSVIIHSLDDAESYGIQAEIGGVYVVNGTLQIEASIYGIYAVYFTMDSGNLAVTRVGKFSTEPEWLTEWPSGTTGLYIGRTFMLEGKEDFQSVRGNAIGDVKILQGNVQIDGWENGIVSDGGNYIQSGGVVKTQNCSQFGVCLYGSFAYLDTGSVKVDGGKLEAKGDAGAIIVIVGDHETGKNYINLPDNVQVEDSVYDYCWVRMEENLPPDVEWYDVYPPFAGYIKKEWRDKYTDEEYYRKDYGFEELIDKKIFVPEIKVQAAEPVQTTAALPTSSFVLVDGKPVAFEAYNIEGNNYFKLRDLAAAFSGSDKQFGVQWDGEKQAISLQSNQPYTGKIFANDNAKQKNATINKAVIYKDGEKVPLQAYNIDGNTYFKLRDIGKLFDFPVNFDAAKNQIAV